MKAIITIAITIIASKITGINPFACYGIIIALIFVKCVIQSLFEK